MSAGLLLIGASGLAREVLAAGITGVTGILDDDESLHGTEVDGAPVVGSVDLAIGRDDQLLVCVGSGVGRRGVVGRLADAGVGDDRFGIFAARSARIGRTSDIAPGSILLDGVVVTADASIGRHVVVMPHCTITHDDVLDDYATLAAGVALGGRVHIREAAYIGMNACVRQDLTVGAESTVGMGSAVVRDIPDRQTWAGVPARALGKSR
jgi:sugar O-acyltransferase (sialic acid O-acetyltransferase NeuD family)